MPFDPFQSDCDSVPDGFVPLEGSEIPRPGDLRDLGPLVLGTGKPDRFPITIHVRSKADAPSVDDLSSPTPADEVLTLEQFKEQFGSSQADIDKVVDYLCNDIGLTREAIDERPGECLIVARGTVTQFRDAFRVNLRKYDSAQGKFFGHEGEIYVPESLDEIIEGISGLDSLGMLTSVRGDAMEEECPEEPDVGEPELDPFFQHSIPSEPESDTGCHGTEKPVLEEPEPGEPLLAELEPKPKPTTAAYEETSYAKTDANVTQEPCEPDVAPMPAPILGSVGSAVCGPDEPIPDGYRIHMPSEFADLYDFPKDYNGKGETIGIISLGGYFHRSDMDQFFRKQGIDPPNIVFKRVGRCRHRLASDGGPPDKSWSRQRICDYIHDFELTLDLQVAGSLAPGARLVVFHVARGASQPYFTALQHAIYSQYKPSIVSISYGSAECKLSPRTMKMASKLFARASRMGVTICASSGDAGSASKDYATIRTRPARPHVNFPASSPFVLACGGTEIETSGGKIVREYAWNDLDQCRLATAGGISKEFERPDYQKSLQLPKPPPVHGDFDGRGVPDVAGNASLVSGYHVLFGGRWDYSGGTSATAPLWAALIARINQGLGRRVGFIHPYLYKLARTSAFRDITEGTNGYYKAGVGWDACTGLGVPCGNALFRALNDLVPQKGSGRGTGTVENSPTPEQISQLSTLVGSANSAAFMAQHAAQLAHAARYRNR